MNIKPFNEKILVRRTKAKEKSDGGILLPEGVRPSSNLAEVVAIGSSDKIRSKVGDKVLLHEHGYDAIFIDGIQHLLVTENDLIGTVT